MILTKNKAAGLTLPSKPIAKLSNQKSAVLAYRQTYWPTEQELRAQKYSTSPFLATYPKEKSACVHIRRV